MTEDEARKIAKTLRMGAYGTRALQVDGDVWGVATWTDSNAHKRVEDMPAGWRRVLAEEE